MFANAQMSLPEPAPDWIEEILVDGDPTDESQEVEA